MNGVVLLHLLLVYFTQILLGDDLRLPVYLLVAGGESLLLVVVVGDILYFLSRQGFCSVVEEALQSHPHPHPHLHPQAAFLLPPQVLILKAPPHPDLYLLLTAFPEEWRHKSSPLPCLHRVLIIYQDLFGKIQEGFPLLVALTGLTVRKFKSLNNDLLIISQL